MNGAIILVVHAAATLFMAGLIWFVQVVHYPLFAGVGAEVFAAYASDHARLTTIVVAPPMLLEMVTGLLLLRWRPMEVSLVAVGLGLLVLVLLWASTWVLQVPQHRILSLGFDGEAHAQLVASNWIRTAFWSFRSLLVLAMVAGACRLSPSNR